MLFRSLYADHSNALRGLANRARRYSLKQEVIPYDPEAAVRFKPEVQSLRAKLEEAYRQKPRARQAQIIAQSKMRLAKTKDPSLAEDTDTRLKLERRMLAEAQASVEYARANVTFTPSEWHAIQSGAVRPNMMEELFANASADHV